MKKELADEHGWDGKISTNITSKEIWVNANFSGEAGGIGQSGKTGKAIWLSKGDKNAQLGYGGKLTGVAHEYKAKKTLRVAKLPVFVQVEPSDLDRWLQLYPSAIADLVGCINEM